MSELEYLRFQERDAFRVMDIERAQRLYEEWKDIELRTRMQQQKPMTRTGKGKPQQLAGDNVGDFYLDDTSNGTHSPRVYLLLSSGWSPANYFERVRHAKHDPAKAQETLTALQAQLRSSSSSASRPSNIANGLNGMARRVSEGMLRERHGSNAQRLIEMTPTYFNNHGTSAKPEPKPRKDEAVSGAAGRVFKFES